MTINPSYPASFRGVRHACERRGASSTMPPSTRPSVNMTDANSHHDSLANSAGKPHLRREWIMASVCLVAGLLVLPALIYLVGTQLLGVYGGGPHIGSFYGDFFRNLLSGTPRTWFIAVAPYVSIWLLRLIFWPWSRQKPADSQRIAPNAPAVSDQKAARVTTNKERREPFVAQ